MPEAVVHVAGRSDPLIVRVNGQDPTFRVATDPIRAKALAEIDPRLLDLLDIASVVFSLDGTVSRGGPTRPRMGIGWRRSFDVEMAVRVPDLWNANDVKSALAEAVNFLTEDSFRFHFTQSPPELPEQPFLDFDPQGSAFDADDVVLFSGGLDSFAGALELLSTSRSNVILVTHRSAQKAIPRQVQLGEYLAEKFHNRVLHIQVTARRVGQEAEDSTQRSRSLLFAALGQVVAVSFGARRLSFFENGIISHNLPLTPQIVGSMATRTTHPLSILKLNCLMRCLGPDLPPIENRFQWLTKTDVVSRIAENGGAEMISRAVSCTSIREQTTLHTHCGACSQCLDRRFAILAAGLEEHEFAGDYETDVLFGARESDSSVTMAVEWTRHSLKFAEMDEHQFLNGFGLELSRIIEGHFPSSSRTTLSQALAMHQRHAQAVRQVLNRAMRERSDDLIMRRLPPTSLFALALGEGAREIPALRQPEPLFDEFVEPEEIDEVPDPDAPLIVAFLDEAEGRVVSVRGLGRVVGQPALIPHALKPVFDEDRGNRLPPNEHRYVEAVRLPLLESMSKDAIRKNVSRCRRALANYFEAVHGQRPSRDLLIESRPPLGHRLDPTIQVIRPGRPN